MSPLSFFKTGALRVGPAGAKTKGRPDGPPQWSGLIIELPGSVNGLAAVAAEILSTSGDR
jgi:hypothetical protein